MKSTTVIFNVKRLRTIPPLICLIIILIGFVCMMLIGYLLTPVYSILDNLEEFTVNIDTIRYMKSSGPFSTSGLEIISDDDQVYYFWYPFGKWLSFSQEVETELLSGEVTSVTMVVSNKQSLQDRLLHRKRIVDLRNDSSVYYSIDAEKPD